MKKVIQIFLIITFIFLFSACDSSLSGKSIKLTEIKENMEIGESFKIQYTVNPSDEKVVFKSSDPTVATVSLTGVVKANSLGTTTITASLVSDQSIYKSFDIKVGMLDEENYQSAPFDEELWPIKQIETGSDEEKIFMALKQKIAEVARGSETSTIFNLSISEIKSTSHIDDIISRVVGLVWLSSPFDMYWYEEASGSYWNWTQNGNTLNISIKFNVSKDYQKSQYEVDSSKKPFALKALENANKIASEATGSDYDKILYFRNQICDLVSYDTTAYKNMNSGKATPGENPWQMISVFDKNTQTNVVCAGYAKAFKYLCDKVGIECIVINGDVMFPGQSREAHLWNVVTLDGKNYIVDITNCDTGSIGSQTKLLLVGATGDLSIGYTDVNTGTKYFYTLLGGGYDMEYLFGSEALIISDTSYIK